MKKLIAILIAGLVSNAAAVTVTNLAATSVTTTSATMRATFTGITSATGTLYYGTVNYTTNAASWANTNSYGAITNGINATNITGLSASHKYYYMWKAAQGGTDTWAALSTNFWTKPIAPTTTPAVVTISLQTDTNGVLKAPTNFFATNVITMANALTNYGFATNEPLWEASSNWVGTNIINLGDRIGLAEGLASTNQTRIGLVEGLAGTNASDIDILQTNTIDRAGARAMQSNLNMGGWSITNLATSSVAFADGVVITSVKIQGYDNVTNNFPAVSNAAITGSNLALQASNQAALAQGWAQAGSNLAFSISGSTSAYSQIVANFPAVSNAAITGSNLANQANGYAIAASNLALVASNQAALAQGWAQAGSNLAYSISLNTGAWSQTTLDFGAVSNAAITGSNLAYAISTNYTSLPTNAPVGGYIVAVTTNGGVTNHYYMSPSSAGTYDHVALTNQDGNTNYLHLSQTEKDAVETNILAFHAGTSMSIRVATTNVYWDYAGTNLVIGVTAGTAYDGAQGAGVSNLAYVASTNAEAARVISTNAQAVADAALPKTVTNALDVQALQVRGGSPTNGAVWLATNSIGQGVWRLSPAFHVHNNNVTQFITNNIWTKVTFSTEAFDTTAAFATSRFTPVVLGTYLIQFNCQIQSLTAGSQLLTEVWKNGGQFKGIVVFSSVSGQTVEGSCVFVDRVTNPADYYEAYIWHNNSGATNISAGAGYTYFSGALLP